MTTIHELAAAARSHADQLIRDIEVTASREEHIRVTARANEAENLAHYLYQLAIAEAGATV
jgi:hypothetical protein